MIGPITSRVIPRRTILKAGAAAGALQVASPFILTARGEVPVKLGMVDPFTGVYAAFAKSEMEGAKLAIDHINKKGGILGRPAELLVEDSANDVGTGVQKTRKLIERDQVDLIIGDVNSGIALAMSGVTSELKKLHIVSGGHTDPITGKDCKWNVFRVCNTTSMDANSIAGTVMEKLGKKWYFLTPDYAYGHSVQQSFVNNLTKGGGTYDGALVPLNTTDYSSYLIKAKAYGPDVLIDVMGGVDQVNSLKQFVQFGLNKQMKVAGSLFELESLRSVPPDALTGWWVMEWWWDQPEVTQVKGYVDELVKITGKKPTARHWFGYVSVQTFALIANREKTLDGVKLAHAMEGFELPPEVALMPNKTYYRAGDHQLMSSVYAGEVHPAAAGKDPDDMFSVRQIVPGDKAAPSVEDTGCKVTWPA